MKILYHSLAFFLFLLLPLQYNLSQNVGLFYPVSNEQNCILLPAIEGTWGFEFFGKNTAFIKKEGDNFYKISFENQQDTRFEGRIFNSGEFQYLEVFPVRGRVENYLSFSSLYRINIYKDSLIFESLNYSWFYKKIEKKALPFSYVYKDKNLLITSPGEQIAKLLNDPPVDLFQHSLSFTRIKNNQKSTLVSDLKGIPAMLEEKEYFYTCVPEFPHKDGWFGADGDISVPVSPNEILWFFSDTFVGQKDQTSRVNSKMVSNSVAIMSCGSDGKPTVDYYWGDMYSEKPKAIFESHTDRYLYWIMDAFTYQDILYVVLNKIQSGTLEPAPKDNFFDFTPYGWTLAKIKNFKTTLPSQWDIEYIPWSQIFDPDLWNGQFTYLDNYFYLFFNKSKFELSLMRIPCEFIENPEGHIEYYIDGKWDKAISVKDADVMFTGQRCNSVRYHADLKKWVMTIGPAFMDYKICIRTADKITGPWSDEYPVFETLEQKPGSELFDINKYCYLAREHLQYYKDKNMVITYDINSKDYSQLINNDYIYTPKVLIIDLNKILKK